MNKFFQRVKESHDNGFEQSRHAAEAVATFIQQSVGSIFAAVTFTWQIVKFIWEWFWYATLISGAVNALLYVAPISRGWALTISSVIHIIIFGVIITLGRKEIDKLRKRISALKNTKNELVRSEPRHPRTRPHHSTNY